MLIKLQKINYSFADEDDDDKNFDKSDDELFDNIVEPRGGESRTAQAVIDDGSDIDEGNDVVALDDTVDSPVAKPKKAAPKRKLGPKSDGPSGAAAKAPAAKRGRKKPSEDSSEEEKPKKVNAFRNSHHLQTY